MGRQIGPVEGNSLADCAVVCNTVADCIKRLELLYEDRAREAKPGEPWEYDCAIEHAKRELAAAIERERPTA